MKESFAKNKQIIIISVLAFFAILTAVFFPPSFFSAHYTLNPSSLSSIISATTTPKVPVFVATHLATPEPLKGIYMTSWVAGTPKLRDGLVKIMDSTEVNAVVIDIKDYSGKIVFSVDDNPTLKAFGSEEVRVKDMATFIDELHKKNIYVIGRLAVFQDAYFVKQRPDLAVKNKAGTATWKDHKGISWIDAGSKDYWDYIIQISKEAYGIGFDEINFDYIRFPSDGDMQDISFPQSSTTPKSIVLKNFFSYLHSNLEGTGLKTSADLFGMTTTAVGDMGIGQILENTLPYFDYIDPMVYPSHYPTTFMGFKQPEAHPYEVVKFAMQSAVTRAEQASTTPAKLRPWLQDFGLQMTYGPEEVKAQIKATNDVGLSSWILWSASNKYTVGALEN